MAKAKDVLVDIARLRQALEEAILAEEMSLERNRRLSELLIVSKWEWDNRRAEEFFWQWFTDLLPKLASVNQSVVELVKLVPNGFELGLELYQENLDWFSSFDLHLVRLERIEQPDQPDRIRFSWIPWVPGGGDPLLLPRRRLFYLKALLAILPPTGTALMRQRQLQRLDLKVDGTLISPVYRLDI